MAINQREQQRAELKTAHAQVVKAVEELRKACGPLNRALLGEPDAGYQQDLLEMFHTVQSLTNRLNTEIAPPLALWSNGEARNP